MKMDKKSQFVQNSNSKSHAKYMLYIFPFLEISVSQRH